LELVAGGDLFGGPQQVEADVALAIDGHVVGQQRMRLIAPGVAFKISGLNGPSMTNRGSQERFGKTSGRRMPAQSLCGLYCPSFCG